MLDIVKENDNDIEFHAVFQRLSEEEIPDLPPGGGLYSKYVKYCHRYPNQNCILQPVIIYYRYSKNIFLLQKTMHRRGLQCSMSGKNRYFGKFGGLVFV